MLLLLFFTFIFIFLFLFLFLFSLLLLFYITSYFNYFNPTPLIFFFFLFYGFILPFVFSSLFVRQNHWQIDLKYNQARIKTLTLGIKTLNSIQPGVDIIITAGPV